MVVVFLLTSCTQTNKTDKSTIMSEVNKISNEAKKVRDYVSKNVVIAHRGSTYWAPEETEPAFRWARNMGADYLELDLQITKDGVLIALHDNDLRRTTDVEEVFPDKPSYEVVDFTLKELRMLDAGSWFNMINPNRMRTGFVGLKILTFKDVVMIAEGFRLKRRNGELVKNLISNEWTGYYEYEEDPKDNGNRPGIYAETKKAGFEEILAKELKELGWDINNNPKQIVTNNRKVGIANTNGRFVLQSFSRKSISKLDSLLPNIPKCLLLWKADMKGDLKGSYIDAINFAVENNVHFIGPSIAGEPNNYEELTAPWMIDLIHQSGMNIHSYTFDTLEQLAEYSDRVEGVFTNRADMALKFFNRSTGKAANEILNELRY
jgi:glycerophosphoryl diester phosphodiesterase